MEPGKVLVKAHGGPSEGSDRPPLCFQTPQPAPGAGPGNFFPHVEPMTALSVQKAMTKKDKIAFIRSSKRKTHVYNDLHRFSDQQLNELIREIVQGLVRESEIIANAYINGYR